MVNLRFLRYILLILTAAVCSCVSHVDESSPVKDVFINKDKSILKLSKVFQELDMVRLEHKSGALIGQVRNILFTDSLIFVFDNLQEKVFCFDSSGAYQYCINAQGGGPLEYISITDFTINEDENTLEIYSFRQGKIIGFDLVSGKPRYDKRFGFYLREFTWLSTGDYLVYSPDIINNDVGGNTIEKGAFLVTDDGKFVKHISVSKEKEYVQTINALSGYGDYVLLVPGYSKEIIEFHDGNWSNRYQLVVSAQSEAGEAYAVPLSVSGSSKTKLIEYGVPDGTVKTVLIRNDDLIEDFMLFNNDKFNFPLKPQLADKQGNLVDILSFEKYAMIVENLGRIRKTKEFDSVLNEEFFSFVEGFDDPANPILIRMKLK